MSGEDLRRWIAGHQEAQRREQAEVRAAGPAPQRAIRAALALIALGARFGAGSSTEDAADSRDDEVARQSWTRLRAALLGRGRAR